MRPVDIPWRTPVVIKLQNGAHKRFSVIYDALDFLENEWPVRKGFHYDKAIDLCRAALMRTVPAEVAREAFMASCIEANLVWLNEVPRTKARQVAA